MMIFELSTVILKWGVFRVNEGILPYMIGSKRVRAEAGRGPVV